MRWLAVFIWMATAAQADETAVAFAWKDWVSDTGVTQSSLAITKDGQLLSAFGVGMAAADVAPLASLSKAITGACVLELIDEGLLRHDSQLSDLLAARPEILGNGGAITIDALLTHTSGLDFDRTQTVLNPSLWGGGDLHDRVSQLALNRQLGAPEFFYSNENYAILGSVIMEVTGQNVEAACRPRVLSGLDSAAVNRRTGGGLAWMGWEMSVADYAAFASRIRYQDSWPEAALGRGDHYGPGVLFATGVDGTTIWHSGAFCVLGLGDYGSYFFVLETGWGVVVSYNKCVDEAELLALIDSLSDATESY